MSIKKAFVLIVILFSLNLSLKAQQSRKSAGNYFGVQVKTFIPTGFAGDQPFELRVNSFETRVSPMIGYSYGGIVRIGLTYLLAIETGLNYARRNFRVNYSVPKIDLYAQDEIGYVSYDIPINLLVYIKLGKQFFMNVGLGVSTNFNASNISSSINPKGKHLFKTEGGRLNHFDFNLNADIGFEYRTYRSGTFYIGLSGRIPFSPSLEIATAYQYETEKYVSKGMVEGSTTSLSFKYFFHNQKIKKDVRFEGGPIEQ